MVDEANIMSWGTQASSAWASDGAAHSWTLVGEEGLGPAVRGCVVPGGVVLCLSNNGLESAARRCAEVAACGYAAPRGAGQRSTSNGLQPALPKGRPAGTRGYDGLIGAGTKPVLSKNSRSAQEVEEGCCSTKGKVFSSKNDVEMMTLLEARSRQ